LKKLAKFGITFLSSHVSKGGILVPDFLNSLSAWFQSAAQQLSNNAGQVLIAILIFLLGLYLARVVHSLLLRGFRIRNTDPELSLLLARIAQWAVLAGMLLFAAQQVGIDVTAILAGLGILGFTLGFALQDVSKNFIAGLLLLLQQPFELGDTIQVSGFTGTIIDINLRDTELRTVDGLRVRIPNGDVFTQPVLNFTGVKQRRLQISLGVSYATDLEKARRVASDTIQAIPGVVGDPAINVGFDSFTDFAIHMNILYWYDATQTGYGEALDAGVRGINAAFQREGIAIAVPGRELRIIAGRDKTGQLSEPDPESRSNPQRDQEANAGTKG
jgi:small conductance mechanosensitive channel